MNKKVLSPKKFSEETEKGLKRFTIPFLNKFSTARSLSPKAKKNLIQEEIDSSKLVRKYKIMRNEEHNRDIRLNELINQLQEEIDKTFEANNMKIVELLLHIVKMAIEYLLNKFISKVHIL